MTIQERVRSLDTGLFNHIPSQTSPGDRESLLALQAALAERVNDFHYLEIGSHLGGTLQPYITDERCAQVTSIDPRPEWQPDEQYTDGCEYPANSTRRMVDLLASVPSADVGKLETLDVSTEGLDPSAVEPADICFVDGEHTYDAALRDARFCHQVIGDRGVLVFHDRLRIERAVRRYLREVEVPYAVWPMRDVVLVVEIGELGLLDSPLVRSLLTRPAPVWPTANRLRAGRLALEAVARLKRR